MTDISVVKLAFGKINLPRASGTLSAWKIEAPFKKTLGVGAGQALGQVSYMEATTLGKHGGGFSSRNVNFPEGTILMVQGSTSRNGMPYNSASLFLRLRSSAAYIIIKYKMPVAPESMLGDRIISFNGRADVVTAEELRVMGIEVARGFETTYLNPEEQAELFDVEILQPEISPPPTHVRIATSQGVEVKSVAPAPVRRMRIRR